MVHRRHLSLLPGRLHLVIQRILLQRHLLVVSSRHHLRFRRRLRRRRWWRRRRRLVSQPIFPVACPLFSLGILSAGGFPRAILSLPKDPVFDFGCSSAGDAGSPKTRRWFLGCRNRSRRILCLLLSLSRMLSAECGLPSAGLLAVHF